MEGWRCSTWTDASSSGGGEQRCLPSLPVLHLAQPLTVQNTAVLLFRTCAGLSFRPSLSPPRRAGSASASLPVLSTAFSHGTSPSLLTARCRSLSPAPRSRPGLVHSSALPRAIQADISNQGHTTETVSLLATSWPAWYAHEEFPQRFATL